MLAASAGRRLALIDPATFKSSSTPPSPSKQTALDVEFTALTWSEDNKSLFVAAEGSIRRYDGAGHFEKLVYSTGKKVSSMVVKDKSTVIYATENEVHKLNCETGSLARTYEGHQTPVTSLSLSNDSSLLAVTSTSGCTVHNLSDASSVSLSGFPSSSTSGISACAFSPHSRTRLLLSYGRYVLVYDTSKPSAPVKSISLASSATMKTMGDVVAVACSPFSKTLVAAACSAGSVCMIDLEKEKGLFKIIDMKLSLTSLAFTADGAALLIGTATGHLLMQDLRSLDKVPKKLIISSEGKPVVGLSMRRKVKNSTIAASQSPAAAAKSRVMSKSSPKPAKPLASQDMNVKPDPASRRTSASTARSSSPAVFPGVSRLSKTMGATNKPFGTPAARRVSAAKETATPVPSRARRIASSPLTSSMAGSENGNAAGRPAPLPVFTKKSNTQAKLSPSPPKPKQVLSRQRSENEKTSSGFSPAAMRTRKVSTTETVRSMKTTSVKISVSSSAESKASTMTLRSRKGSTTSKVSSHTPPVPPASGSTLSGKDKERARLGLHPEPRSRTGSAVSTSTSVSAAIAARKHNVMAAVPSSATSRVSSPDLDNVDVVLPSPTINLNPVAVLLNARKTAKRKGKDDRDLDADDLDGWPISAPLSTDTEKKTVDFDFADEYINKGDESSEEESDQGTELQVSPRRPTSNTALELSPLRRNTPSHVQFPTSGSTSSPFGPFPPTSAPGTPASSAKAHEYMRALLVSALYDAQQESRAGLRGLHLDVLRLGREWKHEAREGAGAMWAEEVRALREENRRLREENERLRMGL